MTPAVLALEASGLDFRIVEYDHDPAAESYGDEAAEATGAEPSQIFKTLLAELPDGEIVVGVVPVVSLLDLKAIARAAGAKKATMADPTVAERRTGYVVGGISPLGQRRRLPTIIDTSARDQPRIFVSAGRRGLEIALDPADLARLTGARFAPISR